MADTAAAEPRSLIAVSALVLLAALPAVVGAAIATAISAISIIYLPFAAVLATPIAAWALSARFHWRRWRGEASRAPHVGYALHALACVLLAAAAGVALASDDPPGIPARSFLGRNGLALGMLASALASLAGAALASWRLARRHSSSGRPLA